MLGKLSTLLAAGALVVMLAPAANALTPARLDTAGDVILAAQGCGRGWVRNAYGRCVPVRPVVVCKRVWTAYGWRRVCR